MVLKPAGFIQCYYPNYGKALVIEFFKGVFS